MRDANVREYVFPSLSCVYVLLTLLKCSSDCSVNGAEDSNFTIIISCSADSVITDVVRADLIMF